MNTFILCFISLIFLNSSFAAVFQHAIHQRESLGMQLKKQDRLKGYAAHKQHQLHGKLSNFKSVSQNISDYWGFDYYVNVTIGTPEQFFTVLLYIQKAIIKISDVNCSVCPNKRTFNSAKSSTYKTTNYFINNDPTNGVYGQDFVRFGSPRTDQLIIPNAMFGQSLYAIEQWDGDGIMGLGLTAENPDMIDSPIITAVKLGILDSPIVTLFLNSIEQDYQYQDAGVITYGAVDTVNCDRNVVYESLSNSNSFQVSIKKASLGSSELSGDWDASIETFLYGLAAPGTVFNAFFKELNGSYGNDNVSFIVDCNIKFNLNLTIGSTIYTFTEKEIVEKFGDVCGPRLFLNHVDKWILGDLWFRSFCTVLDYGNKRLGFTKVITPGATTSDITTLGATTSDITTLGATTPDNNHSSSVHSLNFILPGILLMFIQ